MSALLITSPSSTTRIPVAGVPVALPDRTGIVLGYEGDTAVTLDLRHASPEWLDDLIIAVREVASRPVPLRDLRGAEHYQPETIPADGATS